MIKLLKILNGISFFVFVIMCIVYFSGNYGMFPYLLINFAIGTILMALYKIYNNEEEETRKSRY